MSQGEAMQQRQGDQGARWVCFELAGQRYGLEILTVQEVLTGVQIEPVPGAPKAILGVINLRGHIVTVLDLRRRLGLPSQVQTWPLCLVIVDGPGAPVALRVDRVVDVRSIPTAAIKPLPNVGAGQQPELCGAFVRDGVVLTLLDAGQLVAPLAAEVSGNPH